MISALQIRAQERLGVLYDRLAALLRSCGDPSELRREVSRLEDYFGAENVEFMLGVLAADANMKSEPEAS